MNIGLDVGINVHCWDYIGMDISMSFVGLISVLSAFIQRYLLLGD